MDPIRILSKDGISKESEQEQKKQDKYSANNISHIKKTFSFLISLLRSAPRLDIKSELKSLQKDLSEFDVKAHKNTKRSKLNEYIQKILSKNEDDREYIRHSISGWAGVSAPVIGIGAVMAGVHMAPAFSWYKDALSSLVTSPNAAPIFELGTACSGILMSTLAYGLFMNREHTDTQKFSASLLGASGIALMMTGLIRENVNPMMHYISAFGYFTLAPASLMAWGADMISKPAKRMAGIATFVSGFAASSAYLVTSIAMTASLNGSTFISPRTPTLGLAFPEILESTIVGIWIFGAGLVMLRNNHNATHK